MLRGENASAKSLHSVVQSLESDKVKLELKVKNLELQLKENKRQLSSSSGKTMTTWRFFPTPLLPRRGAGSGADALPPAGPFVLGSPPVNQMRLSTTQVPCEGGVPGIPTSGSSCGPECWQKHKVVDAGCHPVQLCVWKVHSEGEQRCSLASLNSGGLTAIFTQQ